MCNLSQTRSELSPGRAGLDRIGRLTPPHRLCVSQAVDYESRSSYSFSVEVLNPIVDPRFLRRGPFKDRASVRVAVLDADEPPRFSRARYHMDVSENCPPACTVGRVSAVDPDTGLTNNIRSVVLWLFSLTAGDYSVILAVTAGKPWPN